MTDRSELSPEPGPTNAGELPPELLAFAHTFNAGDYFEAHEILEIPWRETRAPFYKALILYASLFVHAQRGNAAGVRKQGAKVLRALAELGLREYHGLQLEQLVQTTQRWIEAADQGNLAERLRRDRPRLDWPDDARG